MFRTLILTFIALNVNAVSLGADESATVEETAVVECPMATAEEVAAVATVLVAPGTEELPDQTESAGVTVVDEIVQDYTLRQDSRKERQTERKARRAERQAILDKKNPDATTK